MAQANGQVVRRAVLAVAPVLAASLLGRLASTPQIENWYAALEKPAFNPPNWAFPVAWTTIYVLMAYALFRILGHAPVPVRRVAILAFAAQILLNIAWPWAFFWAQSPLAGLVVIAPLWVAIAATLLAFWRLDRLAALCLAPYLAWVSFAVVLNAEVYRLN